MRIFNKKAQEMELKTVGDILVGILVLFVIILLIFAIYNVFSNQEDVNAKKTINSVEGKINALSIGQNNTFAIQGFKGATGAKVTDPTWYFIGWSKNDSADSKPDQCFYNSCVCICKGTLEANKKNLAGECKVQGYCRTFDVDSVSVRTVYTNSIFKDMPSYANPQYIHLQNNLLDININKQKNSIEIIHQDPTTETYGILDY